MKLVKNEIVRADNGDAWRHVWDKIHAQLDNNIRMQVMDGAWLPVHIQVDEVYDGVQAKVES